MPVRNTSDPAPADAWTIAPSRLRPTLAASQALGGEIAPLIDALMAPGGIVVGDQVMRAARWEELPLPPGIEPGRYFIRRVRV